MLSEIAAWLFAVLVVDPVAAEVRQRVELANLPVEAVQQTRQCLATQGPALLQKAGDDPAWAVGTAIGVAVGWTSPIQLLDPSDPTCATVVRILQGSDGASNKEA